MDEVKKQELRLLAEAALPFNIDSEWMMKVVGSFRRGVSPAAVLSLLDENAQLRAEVEALRQMLLEASEEIDSWGSYAGKYFQEKHDLEGTVERFHQAAMSKESSTND